MLLTSLKMLHCGQWASSTDDSVESFKARFCLVNCVMSGAISLFLSGSMFASIVCALTELKICKIKMHAVEIWNNIGAMQLQFFIFFILVFFSCSIHI
jgi:hypothetical protein